MTGANAVMSVAYLAPHKLALLLKLKREFGQHASSTLVIAIWALWGLLMLVLIALSVYRARVTRDEAGQIFLDDTFARGRDDEAVIIARVSKLDPPIRMLTWLVSAATGLIVAYYLYEFINRLV